MDKEGPSVGRILAMTIFALTCFGLLLFLWISFGGSVPLKPNQYELIDRFPEGHDVGAAG